MEHAVVRLDEIIRSVNKREYFMPSHRRIFTRLHLTI